MIRANEKDTVKVNYTGKLSDGTVFDQTPQDRPLTFIIGRDEIIPGFDVAVRGMYQGESKTVTIPPDHAYGASDPELLETIDRDQLGEDVELHVGGQLEITNHDNSKFYVMVKELTDTQVVLDANHPLAGKELIFDIELLEVIKEQDAPDIPATPAQGGPA
ncbi:MAG: peptidylprolyl isomerase [Desulfuromonadales bacterium]|nr:peptidylprolyl isomerase [Desulfuromonadales bacterium]